MVAQLENDLGFYNYSLATTLFRNERTYIAPISNRFVAFSPDTYGAPFLISTQAKNLIDRFDGGCSVGSAISTVAGATIDFTTALDLVAFLEERGVLQPSRTPLRYSAVQASRNEVRSADVWLHTNNYCNLDCGYCFVNKFQSSMSEETFLTFVDNLESTIERQNLEAVTIKFAGGEPTLNLPQLRHFDDVLRSRIERRGIKYDAAVLTNGTAVTDAFIGFLKERGIGVSVSLDGYAEAHDLYRTYKGTGKGSWERVSANIQRLLDASIRPYILATLSEASSESLPELLKWIFSRGMRTRLGVVREPTAYFTSGPPTTDRRRNADPVEVRKAYTQLCNIMIRNFERAFSTLESEMYRFNPVTDLQICELHFEQPSLSTCCGIGSSHIVVQDDGRITGCPMTIREYSVPTGKNLLVQISTVFDTHSEARNERKENCLDCQWFPVCVGGCPVNNDRVNGDPYTISPLHEFYQYVIPRYIQFAGLKILQESIRMEVASDHVIDIC